MEEFGLRPLARDLLVKMCSALKHDHLLLRRGIFDMQQDLDRLLNAIDEKRPIYIFTGRGPSSPRLHLGHLVPLQLTRFLGQVIPNSKIVIQLSDDEKFVGRQGQDLESTDRYTADNIKDIERTLGDELSKTLVFRNTESIGSLYRTILQIQKQFKISKYKRVFGYTDDDCVGRFAYPAVQMAPAFAQAFPDFLDPRSLCVVPCAVDQYPHFRLCRAVAQRLQWSTPVLICTSRYVPGLDGDKMSASKQATAIFLSDTREQVERKIGRALSGGRASMEEQVRLGACLERDVPFSLLKYFMESDDQLSKLGAAYEAGRVMTVAVKEKAISEIVSLLSKYK